MNYLVDGVSAEEWKERAERAEAKIKLLIEALEKSDCYCSLVQHLAIDSTYICRRCRTLTAVKETKT
jgi:hypothetical protein